VRPQLDLRGRTLKKEREKGERKKEKNEKKTRGK